MGITLDDVAKHAGVSRALVSLALRGSPRVSDGSRARVQEAAAKLGYRPNLNARRLASRNTETIGVLISDLHNPLYAELLDGFDEHLAGRSEQWMMASGFRDPLREKAAIDSFLALQVEAIVLLGSHLPAETIQELAANAATVVVGRTLAGVDSVAVDDTAGVNLVLEHLIAQGHTSIAHVDGGEGAGARSRRDAYVAVMSKHGLENHISICRGDYTEESGEQAFRTLWQASRPTAIFAANDLSGVGVLSAARSAGVRVPGDLAVAGFDDTTLARSSWVSLTTVGCSRVEMGGVAGELLKERLANRSAPPRAIILKPSLFTRFTTSVPA